MRRRRRRPSPPTASPCASPHSASASASSTASPVAARLHVTRQLDDAEVDAVADDDRPRNAVLELSSVMPNGGRLARANAIHRRDPQRQEQRGQLRRPAVKQHDQRQQHRHHHQHRRERQVLHQRGRLLGRDGDVAGEPDAHARARTGPCRPAPHVGRTRAISAAACAALVEKPPTSISISVTPSLRLEKRFPSRSPPPSWPRVLAARCRRSPAAAPARSRRAGCPSVLRVLPAQAVLDALADRLQILQLDQRGGVRLDEGALGGEAGADVADLVVRVLADARRQVVQETLARGAGCSGRPTSTRTPRYCSPAMRRRSSSMATTLGASRGNSSSTSLRRCA